jgi:hypothetical protein
MKTSAQKLFKTISISLLVLLVCRCCFAIEDTNIVAAGEWSAPVAGLEDMKTGRGAHHPTLRGRLLLCESPKNNSLAMYLEIQDCDSAWGEATEVYCDAERKCLLKIVDASGKSLSPDGFFSGWVQRPSWINLPSDSAIRLRVSRIETFTFASTNDYLVSGTFTVDPPPDHTGLDVFQGTINLPPVKILPKSLSGKLN